MFLRLFRVSEVRRQVGSSDSPGETVAEEVADKWVCGGSDTVKRTGRFGSFWGCSRYPGCHGTQPFKIDQAGQPCRHCQTPVVHQTHTKPKPKHGGSWRSASGGSYFEWWFKCPGCKAIYLVEPARRFFDATDTPEPSSAPDVLPDWAITERAILPWQ